MVGLAVFAWLSVLVKVGSVEAVIMEDLCFCCRGHCSQKLQPPSTGGQCLCFFVVLTCTCVGSLVLCLGRWLPTFVPGSLDSSSLFRLWFCCWIVPSFVLWGVFYGAVLFFQSNEIHLALLYDLKKKMRCSAQPG